MTDTIFSLFSEIYTVITVIACIFYICQCLFGYKLLKFSCALTGFIFGLIFGYIIGNELMHLAGAWIWLPTAVFAVVLCLLAYKLYLVGVFILIFVMCFFMALAIPFPSEGVWDAVAIVVAIVLGIVAAILAVRYNKYVVIIFTAIFGALNFVRVFDKLSGVLTQNLIIYIASVAGLAVIGLLVQIFMNRR